MKFLRHTVIVNGLTARRLDSVDVQAPILIPFCGECFVFVARYSTALPSNTLDTWQLVYLLL